MLVLAAAHLRHSETTELSTGDKPEVRARPYGEGYEIQLVPIRIRYVDSEERPAGESLWAEPAEADGAGGTFKLPHDLTFTSPLSDEVVRCDLDAESIPKVTSVGCPVPGFFVECTDTLTALRRSSWERP